MSTAFFIGPFDPALWKEGNPDPEPATELSIDPVDYSQKLLERWPHAKAHNEVIGIGRSWTLDESNVPGMYVLLQTN